MNAWLPSAELALGSVRFALYTGSRIFADRLSDWALAAFQVGDRLQRGSVDLVTHAGSAAYLTDAVLEIAGAASDGVRNYLPADNRALTVAELNNNFDVFNLVRHVNRRLDLTDSPPLPLLEFVERAYRLGPFAALWAIEGLGHDYAARAVATGQQLPRLLIDPPASGLPESTLTMMHAGMGLAFAEHLLSDLTPYSEAVQIRSVLSRYIELCDANSRPGFEGAAYESLGLYARVWHPEVVALIDRELRLLNPPVLAYFWHGVGRALNFLPQYIVPGILSPWREIVRGPHELARLNLTAGLAWAFTLVNMRQPRLMENLLRRRGDSLVASEAFSNGVSSAVVMRLDTTPDDPYLKAFCEYRPASSGRQLVKQWDALVTQPCRHALTRFHGILRKRRRLGEIFRYQELADLVDRLERTSPAT